MKDTTALQKQSQTKGKESTTEMQKEHGRWREIQGDRKCKNYSKMSYWQVVSHCTIL